MKANKSKNNGKKPRIKPIERVSDVLIEWINRIIIARPRKTEAIIAQAAMPFVDGKKSHWQVSFGGFDRHTAQ